MENIVYDLSRCKSRKDFKIQIETPDYNKEVQKFLENSGILMTIIYDKTESSKIFSDRFTKRDIYSISLQRGKKTFTFEFTNSLYDSGIVEILGAAHLRMKDGDYYEEHPRSGLHRFSICELVPPTILNNEVKKVTNRVAPSAYDILACLDYFEGDFEEFCGMFGYDTDSLTAHNTFLAVEKQSWEMAKFFTDAELEQIAEIN